MQGRHIETPRKHQCLILKVSPTVILDDLGEKNQADVKTFCSDPCIHTVLCEPH